MRLTLHTDYALRVLMRLGMAPGETVTIERIALEHDISKNHLMKVALTLGRLGYVETVRGRSGGLRLKARPEDVRIGEVVVAMEPDMAVVECMRGGACRIGSVCRLRHALRGATAAFIAHLNQFTLADFVHDRSALEELLAF